MSSSALSSSEVFKSMNLNSGVRAFDLPRRAWESLIDPVSSLWLEEASAGEIGSDSAVRCARSNRRDGVYSVRPAIVQSV